jgi:hypothetical protein
MPLLKAGAIEPVLRELSHLSSSAVEQRRSSVAVSPSELKDCYAGALVSR